MNPVGFQCIKTNPDYPPSAVHGNPVTVSAVALCRRALCLIAEAMLCLNSGSLKHFAPIPALSELSMIFTIVTALPPTIHKF